MSLNFLLSPEVKEAWLAQAAAQSICITDVEDLLKLLSLSITSLYTVFKMFQEYKKQKEKDKLNDKK